VQVWDSYGRLLFQSSPFEHSITSAAWAPGGGLFAVGSFNCLALCDKMGWLHSKARTSSGSLYALAWAADGMQVGRACVYARVCDAACSRACACSRLPRGLVAWPGRRGHEVARP
jgi:intraflagellar transport protein 80